jgi:hypothetical protein
VYFRSVCCLWDTIHTVTKLSVITVRFRASSIETWIKLLAETSETDNEDRYSFHLFLVRIDPERKE